MSEQINHLEDISSTLVSIYELLERMQEKAAERHEWLMKAIEDVTGAVLATSSEEELRKANKALERIARDIG